MNKNLKLRLEAYDIKLLEDYIKTLKKLTEKDTSYFRLPTKIKKFTVLRSPHVNKQSREQFEIRTHRRLFYFNNIKNIENISNIINESLPAGISGRLIKD